MVVFNYLLNITPSSKRSFEVAKFNTFVGIGSIGGTFVGSIIVDQFYNFNFFIFQGLQIMFLISFIFRVVTLPMIFGLKDEKENSIGVKSLLWKTVAEEPSQNIAQTVKTVGKYQEKFVKNIKSDVEKFGFIATRPEENEFVYLAQNLQTKPSIKISRDWLEKSEDIPRILEKVRKKNIVLVSFDKEDIYSVEQAKKECEKLGSNVYRIDNWLLIVPKEIRVKTG